MDVCLVQFKAAIGPWYMKVNLFGISPRIMNEMHIFSAYSESASNAKWLSIKNNGKL